MFELGKSIDCIPYLDFNEETKEWIICFQRLDGLNGKVYDLNIFNNPKWLHITYIASIIINIQILCIFAL